MKLNQANHEEEGFNLSKKYLNLPWNNFFVAKEVIELLFLSMYRCGDRLEVFAQFYLFAYSTL